MSSYGTGSSPYTYTSAYGKRSISCSNGYAKLSPSGGSKGASTNNNNHFYSRLSTASPGPSVLSPQQSRGGMSNYRTSTTSSYVPNLYSQHKMPSSTSYARNNIFVDSPLARHREETSGHLRIRSRDLPLTRDLPVKSTYFPDPKDDTGRAYQSGSLLKKNADANDLSIVGLTLSTPSKNLKKSSSHQDMLHGSNATAGVPTNFSSNRYITASNGFNSYVPRALPEFRSSPTSRKTPPSDLPPPYQVSRRSSITRGRSTGTATADSNEGTGSAVRSATHSLVADTVARLNRRNEAEKMLTSVRVQQNQQQSVSAPRRFSLRDNSTAATRESSNDGDTTATQTLNDESSTSSSSSKTGSPNNNTNNLSILTTNESLFASQSQAWIKEEGHLKRSNFDPRHEKKYATMGTTGLQNIGNTCFMNCVLQCLSNTRPLLELCLNHDLLKEKNTETSRLKGDLASAYVDLMQSMWKGLDSVSPSNFKYQVSRFARLFVGYNQQDAQEFLMYLLQGLHEDLNRVRDKKNKMATRKLQDMSYDDENTSTSEKAILSWKRHLELENSYVVDLFEGLLKSALKCRSCGYVSNTFDPFLGLSLPIKKVSAGSGNETSLIECLELFTHEEVLDENEKTTCDKCKKKQNSTKRLTIQKFPKILVINLKRFSEESFFRSKLSTPVRCPTRNLDLRKFSDESVGDRAIYSLYGVCNHSGTPMGGHYTALAKNPYSNEWHHFNDQRVSYVSENSNLVSSEAYILFYELSSK